MGLIDEILEAGRNAGRIAVDTVAAFNATAQAGRVNREMDERMAKAAAVAIANGKDGTHDLEAAREPKALHFDPFDLVAAMGYRERPSSLAFSAMERIGRSVPVIADIVKARSTQVATFCKPPEDRHAPGFEVRLRDWKTAPVTKATEKRAAELSRCVLDTGWVEDDTPHDAVPLETFARMFIEDSLIYDQAVFEVIPDRAGRPAYINIVDASTIRLLDPGARDPGDPFAVQVVNGAIVMDFVPDELAFCVRNPRSGIKSYGYGCGEIETLVREITGLLWGLEYNRKFFSQGSAAKGILNFKGTLPEKHLQAFQRQWYAMVSGVANAWRTPITNAEELQWINLQMSNRDMEYSHWIDFLIKVCCARFQIATEEVGFSYGNTSQSQAMGQAPIEEKLKASRDSGLRPLVYWFFGQLNRFWLQRIDPDFEVVPTGLDAKGEESEAALMKEQTAIYLTVDEARERAGLEPIGPDKGGDAILNPTWLQYVQGKQAAEQQQQQQDGSIAAGAGEDGGDDFNAQPQAEHPQGAPPPGGDPDDPDALDDDFEVGPSDDDEPQPLGKSLAGSTRLVVDV